MVIGTTNSSIDIIKGRLSFGSALATNIHGFFSQVNVPLIFWNSAKIAILSTILTLAVSSFAGYGFAERLRGRFSLRAGHRPSSASAARRPCPR